MTTLRFPGAKRFTLEVSPETTDLDYTLESVASVLVNGLGDKHLDQLLGAISSQRASNSLMAILEQAKTLDATLSLKVSPNGDIVIGGLEPNDIPEREDLDNELQLLEEGDEDDD